MSVIQKATMVRSSRLPLPTHTSLALDLETLKDVWVWANEPLNLFLLGEMSLGLNFVLELLKVVSVSLAQHLCHQHHLRTC